VLPTERIAHLSKGRETAALQDFNPAYDRFGLMHSLPQGLHRIRFYGLLAGRKRNDNIARARELLATPLLPIEAIKAATTTAVEKTQEPKHACPCCGGRMIIIERFQRGCSPGYRPAASVPVIRVDTS
jgi:hypothetical protein